MPGADAGRLRANGGLMATATTGNQPVRAPLAEGAVRRPFGSGRRTMPAERDQTRRTVAADLAAKPGASGGFSDGARPSLGAPF